MKALIIEDEHPAVKRLSKLLNKIRPEIQVCQVIDSVEGAVEFFTQEPALDLIFMDIQLADGLSFEIFNLTKIHSPVIFTTAYDQYTLKAFKVNSVDYLLKPIDVDELQESLQKFDAYFNKKVQYNNSAITEMLQALQQPTYKERFIVKAGQQLTFISIEEINYFYSEGGMVFAKASPKKKHIIDYTLDQLENLLNPASFFRLNRKIIVNIDAIRKISTYFNSRLILDLNPKADFEVIVSRDRVSTFKKWLDQ